MRFKQTIPPSPFSERAESIAVALKRARALYQASIANVRQRRGTERGVRYSGETRNRDRVQFQKVYSNPCFPYRSPMRCTSSL